MTVTKNWVVQVNERTLMVMERLADLNLEILMVSAPINSGVTSIIVNPNDAEELIDYFRYKFGRPRVKVVPVATIPIDKEQANFISREVLERGYNVFYANESNLFVMVDEEE